MKFKDFSRTSPKIEGLLKTMRTLFVVGSNSHYHSLDYDIGIVPLDPKN